MYRTWFGPHRFRNLLGNGGWPMTLTLRHAIDSSGKPVDITIADRVLDGVDTTAPTFDATGLVAVPGFIDVQTNGGIGHDFTVDPSSIWAVGAWLPSTGVTAFCPTIITAPPGAIERAQRAIGSRPDGYVGAEPLGLHIEGPHISVAKHGTHSVELLQDPAEWSASTDHIAIVTIAPELPGALALIRDLVARGVVVSIGHSAASAEAATAALDAGATLGTHIFNAMPPISAREPGIAGVLLTDPRAYFNVIVDDFHLAPETLRLLWTAGRERFVAITDAMAAAGMPDGTFAIGDIEVTMDNGAVRNRIGGLAGSSLTLDQGLRNIIDVTGASLAEASNAVSKHPADVLRIDDRGQLRPGAVGDVVLLDDLQVVTTIIGGSIVHSTCPNRMEGGADVAP
jgi:N-acetylglucosamine-6-phosphate deacetylase